MKFINTAIIPALVAVTVAKEPPKHPPVPCDTPGARQCSKCIATSLSPSRLILALLVSEKGFMGTTRFISECRTQRDGSTVWVAYDWCLPTQKCK